MASSLGRSVDNGKTNDVRNSQPNGSGEDDEPDHAESHRSPKRPRRQAQFTEEMASRATGQLRAIILEPNYLDMAGHTSTLWRTPPERIISCSAHARPETGPADASVTDIDAYLMRLADFPHLMHAVGSTFSADVVLNALIYKRRVYGYMFEPQDLELVARTDSECLFRVRKGPVREFIATNDGASADGMRDCLLASVREESSPRRREDLHAVYIETGESRLAPFPRRWAEFYGAHCGKSETMPVARLRAMAVALLRCGFFLVTADGNLERSALTGSTRSLGRKEAATVLARLGNLPRANLYLRVTGNWQTDCGA